MRGYGILFFFSYLLCRILESCSLRGGEAWNCQESRELSPESADWFLSSSAISFSSWIKPGGSTPYLLAILATSRRHKMTFRGLLWRTARETSKKFPEVIFGSAYRDRRSRRANFRGRPENGRTWWSSPCCRGRKSCDASLSRNTLLISLGVAEIAEIASWDGKLRLK